jgi:hypothetical protein
MAISDVRQYFRDRMSALNYSEWRDGFNIENVPSSILEGTYHIESGEIASTASNHQIHTFECPIILRIFIKGFNDPIQAIDDAFDTSEDVLAEILLPSNRLDEAIKDVVPDSINVEPLSTSNDNSMILVMTFTCITIMKF